MTGLHGFASSFDEKDSGLEPKDSLKTMESIQKHMSYEPFRPDLRAHTHNGAGAKDKISMEEFDVNWEQCCRLRTKRPFDLFQTIFYYNGVESEGKLASSKAGAIIQKLQTHADSPIEADGQNASRPNKNNFVRVDVSLLDSFFCMIRELGPIRHEIEQVDRQGWIDFGYDQLIIHLLQLESDMQNTIMKARKGND